MEIVGLPTLSYAGSSPARIGELSPIIKNIPTDSTSFKSYTLKITYILWLWIIVKALDWKQWILHKLTLAKLSPDISSCDIGMLTIEVHVNNVDMNIKYLHDNMQ